MSPLSIRSTLGFLGRQYHYRTISDRDLLRKALITEDALRTWRTKYPADPCCPDVLPPRAIVSSRADG